MFSIKVITKQDRAWVRAVMRQHWGSEQVVVHGTSYLPHRLPGLIARDESGEKLGLLTYHIEGTASEIVTLNSFQAGLGVGSALIEAMKEIALQAGNKRLWLVTTNDNLDALKFYQKRGFHLAAIRPNALSAARKLKPEIPMIGQHGIPLRDEIELEMFLET